MQMYSYNVTREETPKGSIFVAWFPELPGLRAQADSQENAVESLFELLPRFRAAMDEIGVPVEQPAKEIMETLASFTIEISRPDGAPKWSVGTANHQPA